MSRESDNTTGVDLNRVVQYLDQLLETATTPDYPSALNGLQLSNTGSITKVAAAVDFSSATVNEAVRSAANLLIVHHGMFWAGLQPLTGRSYARVRALINADIAVYSSHLPLDRHRQLGNNALLARSFGLEPTDGFAQFRDVFIGVQGKSDIPTSALIDYARNFSRRNGGDVIVSGATNDTKITKHWAICTGAGASAETLAEATSNGIDTLLVGEGPHWTAIEAAEREITVIYLGHYASETLGVYALADNLSEEFNIPSVKISSPTGL